MPFESNIDKKTNLAVIYALGHCDVPSCVEMLKAVAADPLFNSETKILVETKYANTPTMTESVQLSEALVSITAFHGHKLAVIAETIELFVMNKLIAKKSFNKGVDLKVFTSAEAAKIWLDNKDLVN